MNAKTANQFESIEEFLSGALLLIDKPLGWTSFDVMGKIKSYVRHHLVMPKNANGDQPKFRVGHAGTLDPLATGLLVVCTGKMTKSIDAIQSGLKEYTGTIYLGKTTPSYDLETEPEGDYPVAHITEEMLRQTAASFIGEQWQTPPIYSAKQINGKRAYESARAGKHVEIPPARIHIHAFEITRIELSEVDFLIRCSKGTYIRTIAHEFGQRLQSGSYLKALRRTESHPYRIEDSMTPNALMQRLDELKAHSPFAKK
ncbi:MAG TPA: tRNA pseudouridine(55) synthase TruB [Flavobacteriales bacterium]